MADLDLDLDLEPEVVPAGSRWSGGPARRFLRLARRGAALDVVAFLGAEPEFRAEEMVAVLRADQRRRRRAGEAVLAEWYFGRFPGLFDDEDLALDLIFSEFLLRESLGEAPEVDEYLARFPRFAGAIRLQAAFHVAIGDPDTEPDRAPKSEAPPNDFPAIPGFEILREVGRGGMGVVYEAYQVGLKRRVALKMVLNGRRDGPETEARFRKEAEAAARLHHPNIVEIHDIGDLEGRPFFTLELVEGGDLSRELAAGPDDRRRRAAADGPRPWPGRSQYAHQQEA